MASEPGNQAAPSGTFNKLKSALGLQPTPKPLSQGLGPINTHPALSRQDSFPGEHRGAPAATHREGGQPKNLHSAAI
jgi:hypothetical protein